jgi:hypothetical protein
MPALLILVRIKRRDVTRRMASVHDRVQSAAQVSDEVTHTEVVESGHGISKFPFAGQRQPSTGAEDPRRCRKKHLPQRRSLVFPNRHLFLLVLMH